MSCSPAASRRAGRSSGSRRSGAKLIGLRARAGAGEEADALGRRRAGDRGHGGRRPYRPGLDLACWRRKSCRIVAKDIPVFVAGGIGRGEAIAAYLEMGAVGVQLGTRFVCATRVHRPRQLQEGVHPRLGPRRDPLGPDRPAPAGHPGPRAQEPRDGEFRRQAARGRADCSTRARSRWPRPSSRSSIIGPARCAAR